MMVHSQSSASAEGRGMAAQPHFGALHPPHDRHTGLQLQAPPPNAPVGRLSASLDVLSAVQGETGMTLFNLESMIARLEAQITQLGGDLPPGQTLQNSTGTGIGPAPVSLAERLSDERDRAQLLRDRLAALVNRLAFALDALDAVR